MTEPQPPSAEGWVAGLIAAAKGLTLTNVLIIALLVLIAIPAYFVYSVLNDPAVMDRFLSSYTEVTDDKTDCTVRKARARGGPWLWSISAGFAFQRSSRWSISVILPAEPNDADIASYCATLALIVDRMLFDDGNPN
jgi:hypothetical protein